VSLRSRGILVAVLSVLALLLVLPSFFPEQRRLESAWIPDQGINLGLDLQGGIHWLLRIDESTALRQELERDARVLEESAKEDGIRIEEIRVREDDAIEARGDLDKLASIVADDAPSLEIEREGDRMVLRLSRRWREEVIDRGVRQALEVLEERVDALGVREPIIAPQGEGRILVQLPGGDMDPASARKVLGETTFLEFKKVLAAAPNEDLLRARYPDGLPADTMVAVARNPDGSVSEAYLVPTVPALTGAMLEDARVGYGRRNEPLVQFTWNAEGTRIFRDFTGENIGERLAAIIDGTVVTAPVIQSRIGRSGQITGSFTPDEAATLAVSLRSGALPIPLVIEEERTVGPALGADSIRKGLRSLLLGTALVFAFMGLYYRKSGWFANVALLVNVALILAAMSLAQATLTLPGMAGLVLTIGMAVDANVIIFERIREELRSGKGMKTAVDIGFRRSFLTILDANVTTMITALVLLQFATGAVKGFGVVLAIGIVTTVFTAMFVTRLLCDLALTRNPEALKI
jgi:preprotein translocase subunit SecD